MNKLVTAVLLGCLPLAAPVSAEQDLTSYKQQGKERIQQFFGDLKGELVGAMKEGGPVHAIQVCNTVAPGIAHKYSTDGWNVARTSLKLRNPNNAPDAWERQVLEKFEARKAAGEDPMQIAYAEVVEQDGAKTFRMMKAIPTAEVCLKCHGTDVAGPVKAKLEQLYPQDRATGYNLGDIRGAFTLQKKL